MTRRAVFRFDAGAATGLGHAIRCLALADELGARNWEILFCANAGAKALIERLRPLRWAIEEGDFADPAALAAAAGACDVLVIDHYGLDARYEKSCRAWAQKIVVIDDLADRAHACDLLLDQTFGRMADAYTSQTPGARLLLGSDYALLDRRFARLRPQALARREADAGVASILIALGGAPPWAMLSRLAYLTAKAAPEARIDIAAGANAAATPADLPANVYVHAADADIATLMANADLAIGAGGGTSWERCTLGLPTIMVEIADNQRQVAQSLADAGAVALAGRLEALDDAVLIALVCELVADTPRRRAMAGKAAAICDGLGARRVARAVDALFEPAPFVTTRPARAGDGEAMLAWQQTPNARRFSNDPNPPQRDAHFAWLHRRLGRRAAGPFEIIEADGAPAGVVRFDREVQGYRVSILVAEEFQGKGVATRGLTAAGRLLPEHALIAQVMPENEASQRLFQACGYTRTAPDEFRRDPLSAS